MSTDPAPSEQRKRVVLTSKEAADGFGRALCEIANNLLADGKLDASEATALKQWLEACGESDLPALNYVREEVQRYAADGRVPGNSKLREPGRDQGGGVEKRPRGHRTLS